MVHLAFFDNFPISPPPPPPPSPHAMLDQLAQGVPREATLYGGEGGGPILGRRAAFFVEQGEIMKKKQIFKVYHILLIRIVDNSTATVSYQWFHCSLLSLAISKI